MSKTVLNSISETINKVQEHFENSKIVEQYSWGTSGFTPKGIAIIDEAIKKYNQSLTTTGKHIRETGQIDLTTFFIDNLTLWKNLLICIIILTTGEGQL